MKRVLYTVATWIKSLFTKKSKPESKEYEFPEIGTFESSLPIYNVFSMDENDSDEDLPWVKEKKQIVKDFNEKNSTEKWVSKEPEIEHKEVLKGTYKKEKFTKNKNENTVMIINDKEYSLTKKQHFFFNEALKIYHLAEVEIIDEKKDYPLKPIDMNEVCKRFIDLKFGADKIQQDIMYKPSYHKKTINYLVKVGLFKKVGQNTYKVLSNRVFF